MASSKTVAVTADAETLSSGMISANTKLHSEEGSFPSYNSSYAPGFACTTAGAQTTQAAKQDAANIVSSLTTGISNIKSVASLIRDTEASVAAKIH